MSVTFHVLGKKKVVDLSKTAARRRFLYELLTLETFVDTYTTGHGCDKQRFSNNDLINLLKEGYLDVRVSQDLEKSIDDVGYDYAPFDGDTVRITFPRKRLENYLCKKSKFPWKNL